jgi:hypothetical protein
MLMGCRNPETVAYKSSKTAHITATAALKAWRDYVAAKHPPVEQEKKVQAAWDTYKAAQLTLLDATKAYMAAGSPPPATAQQKFDQALVAGAAALADLIGLIQQLGVKL